MHVKAYRSCIECIHFALNLHGLCIEFALKSPAEALEFAKKWGRGIDDETNKEFVSMYVNDRTIDYKEEGRASVRKFIGEGQDFGLIRSDFNAADMSFIGSNE